MTGDDNEEWLKRWNLRLSVAVKVAKIVGLILAGLAVLLRWL